MYGGEWFLCCTVKCRWSVCWTACVYEEMLSTVGGTETKEECLPTQEWHSICQKIWETHWNSITEQFTYIHLKWFTHSGGGGKLLGKVLHHCHIDLVVKVNKIAPLLLPRSWIMCWWCVRGQDAVAVVSIICNQQYNKSTLFNVEVKCPDLHYWHNAGNIVWVTVVPWHRHYYNVALQPHTVTLGWP